MADARKYVQAQFFTVYGAGSSINDTTLTLVSFNQINGTALTLSDFGTKGFGTVEPGSGTQENQISFTGVTANANGTVTLTGVSTVGMVYPYTETSGMPVAHAGGVRFEISNTAGFYNTFANTLNDETIVGTWSFTTATRPALTVDADTAVAANLITFGQLSRTAISGGVPATTTTLGLVKMSTAPVDPLSPIAVGDNDTRVPTQAENNALVGNNTDIAVGTGNKYVTQTGLQKSAETYAVDAQASDTYVVTLSPVPTSYAAGMTVRFKAATANTGAATLNVNSLGAIAITKNGAVALQDNDIKAGQVITVVYESATPSFQIQSLDKMSQANATTLTASTTSNADTLHTHSPLALIETLFAGSNLYFPLYLENALLSLTGSTPNGSFSGSFYYEYGGSNANAATIYSNPLTFAAGSLSPEGVVGNAVLQSLATKWTMLIPFYWHGLPSSTDDFFVGVCNAPSGFTSGSYPTTQLHAGYGYDGTNWFVSNADGATPTKTTVTAPSVGKQLLKIQRTASSIIFSLNNVVLSTSTTNLPASGDVGFLFACANDAGASTGAISLFRTLHTVLDFS